MKGKLKYIVLFLTALALSALAVLPAWADSNNSCDICIETTYEPDDHCSYYCTGDGSDTCDCGGEMVVWCAAEHQYDTLQSTTTGADCNTSGTETYACACGATITYTTGPVGDHQWGQGEVDTTVGKIYYTCTICGETKSENYTPGETTTPTDPDPDETTTTPTDPTDPEEPTDPEDPDIGGGSTGDTTCTHVFTVVKIDPACETQGYTLHTCQKCTYSYKDNYVDALGHDPITTNVQATCTEKGLMTTYCQRDECQKILGQYETAAKGHNFVNNVCTRCGLTNTCAHTFIEKVYKPTCHDFGYTLFTCTICEYAYMDNYTAQLSHVWQLGDIIQPTCEQAGRKESTCTLCGEFETEVLPATGHKWEAKSSVVGEDNTTNVTYKCSVCGKTKVETLPTAAAQAQNWLLTSIRGASAGLIDIYNTIASGVSIGGVTVGEVISGALVLVIIVLLFGFIWNKGRK